MSKNLKLSFPKELEGQEFLIDSDPSSLKKILKESGLSNLTEEIKRFNTILYDVNRCPKSISKASDLLKVFHSKYSNLSNTLRDYSEELLEASSPELDQLMNQVTLEMTYAYKAYVYQLYQNTKWILGFNKKVAHAINQAIHYLNLYKTELYHLDEPLPSFIWQEIYQLYNYAENLKLTKVKLKDKPDNKIKVSSSISSTFSRAALLASMDPFNLTSKELWNLFHALNHYIDLVDITPNRDKIQTKSFFVFDLDMPQRPLLTKENHDHSSRSRYLWLEKFAHKVKADMSDFSSQVGSNIDFLSNQDEALKEKLLQLIYRYSVQYIARETDRYPMQVEAKALWGLSSIMALLESNLGLDSFPKDNSLESTLEEYLEVPTDWQTLNESNGGACIQRPLTEEFKLNEQMPLLISKRLANHQGRWQLAISRWQSIKENKVQAGIQYIKGSFQLAKLVSKEPKYYLCLGPDSSEKYFLLTPSGALEQANKVIIELTDSKVLANKKSILKCHDADLVQIEVIKKS